MRRCAWTARLSNSNRWWRSVRARQLDANTNGGSIHAYPDTFPDGDANCNADCHADAHAHANANSYCDGDLYAVTNSIRRYDFH